MALVDVIASFATPGPYTVTRTTASTYLNGRLVAGTTSQFTITASVQPVSGRDLKALPEARHGEEVRVVYTTTALNTLIPTHAADVVTLDSEPWEVFRVERWQAFGNTHYRAFVARRVAQ